MRRSLILLLLIVLLKGCSKSDDLSKQEWIKGQWIGTYSQPDTLCFTSYLQINDGFPYSYWFTDEGIILWPSISSSTNDMKLYKYTINRRKNYLTLYSFRGYGSASFLRTNNECK